MMITDLKEENETIRQSLLEVVTMTDSGAKQVTEMLKMCRYFMVCWR